MTLQHGHISCITGPLWGEPPVTRKTPSQKNFDAFLDVRLNKLWNKQLCNDLIIIIPWPPEKVSGGLWLSVWYERSPRPVSIHDFCRSSS